MSARLRGQLAERMNVHPETIRFYEREGLMPDPARNASGYRVYTEADEWRLAFIQNARAAGFSLARIKELFRAVAQGDVTDVPSLAEQVDREIAELDAKIERLESMRSALEAFKAQGDDAAQCPHIRAFLGGFRTNSVKPA